MATINLNQVTDVVHQAAAQLAELEWIDQEAAQQLGPLAEAVANMLKKDYGINSNRMVIEYVGKEKPYYKNNNKWNRCAMVEIIK